MILIMIGGWLAGWLNIICDREQDCSWLVFFWMAGTSYLLTGGSATELFRINKTYRNHIIYKPVFVLGSPVQQNHKVIFVPLLYTCQLQP